MTKAKRLRHGVHGGTEFTEKMIEIQGIFPLFDVTSVTSVSPSRGICFAA